MSNKFTSRERIAMIVVAGVVAIAIAVLALRRNDDAVPVQPQTAVAPTHVVVTDKADTTKTKAKRKSKAGSSKKVKTVSPKQPKARDYFTAPENE